MKKDQSKSRPLFTNADLPRSGLISYLQLLIGRLKQYGLVLEKAERNLEVFVIREKE
ncbi:MAG: hypothetical protein QM763_19405 [Agriterribacter sp.]